MLKTFIHFQDHIFHTYLIINNQLCQEKVHLIFKMFRRMNDDHLCHPYLLRAFSYLLQMVNPFLNCFKNLFLYKNIIIYLFLIKLIFLYSKFLIFL